MSSWGPARTCRYRWVNGFVKPSSAYLSRCLSCRCKSKADKLVCLMLKQHLGSLSSADADNVSLEPGQVEDEISANASALAQSARDQLAREVADIEAAT